MSKLANNPLDLKSDLMKTKHETFDFNIDDELINLTEKKGKQEKITPTVKTQEEKQEIKKQKTYRFSPSLINDMDKVVYMDRDLRGNETTLVTRAIEQYLASKENQDFMKQYDELKNNK